MAYDMHSILAMSAKCERVFSSTKLLITDLRARMRDDIMEASECLKAWDNIDTSLINLEELQLIILQRAEKERVEERSKGTGRTDVTDKINGTDKTSGTDGAKRTRETNETYETSGI